MSNHAGENMNIKQILQRPIKMRTGLALFLAGALFGLLGSYIAGFLLGIGLILHHFAWVWYRNNEAKKQFSAPDVQ